MLEAPPSYQRRSDLAGVDQSGEYFGGSRRYYDNNLELMVINVHAGDFYVSTNKDEMAATVLGSCISACIRDPITGVGGMNHFMLPDAGSSSSESARFGAYAMEQLINEILKRGGRKERLEVKIFGGANVIKSSAMIGDKNCEFVKEYLKNEGLLIETQDLGGNLPRKVRYFLDTGKVKMRRIQRAEDFTEVQKEEKTYIKQVDKQLHKPDAGDVELF